MRLSRVCSSVFAGACVAVVAAGCAEVEAGSPVAGVSGPSSPSSSSMVVPPSRSSGGSTTPVEPGSPLDSVDACALLTADEIAQFGDHDYKEPKSEDIAGYPTCRWLPIRTDARRLPTITTVLWDDVSIDQLRDRGSGVERGQMDSGRDFTQTGTSGECTVALAVGEQARVDALVTGVDQDEACALANQVAEIVEPRIPEG